MSEIDFKKLPKIELHLHLDTSVPIEVIRKYLIREGHPVPEPLKEACVGPAKCKSLVDYLERIDPALKALQSADAIEETAYQMAANLAANNHFYTEIRFAPHLHLEKGETIDSIFSAAKRGYTRAKKDFGIDIGIILCALRHFTPEQNEPLVKFALQHQDQFCGFDLASDESISGERQRRHFDTIHQAGIPITVHAGEACGPERIMEAVDMLHAQRIGHGVRLFENPNLLDRLKKEQIPLEMCPTSNVQTNATASFETHPIDRYLNEGVCVTVNTDSNTITPSNLTKEYEILNRTFNWGLEQFKQTQKNAIRHAFVSEEKRKVLDKTFDELFSKAVNGN